MQIEVQSKSKSLLGVSDLTLAAPIRRGLIPALDARSYESRLRLLLRTLNTLRVSSLEAERTPLIADAVDRIRAIHSFRLAIVGDDPFKQLVLAVTFDGGWEPYMRRIWRDLGPLLDVIFCNCEGYLVAHDHGFAEYAGWVRRAQVGTEFFFNASALTVNDLHYLRESARRGLGGAGAPPVDDPAASPDALLEQALPALTALYRLTDMYPPRWALPSLADRDDGGILWRAARHLLAGLAAADHDAREGDGRPPVETAALHWFRSEPEAGAVAPVAASVAWDADKPQAGIVSPPRGLTHGCLLLVGLEEAAAAEALIAAVQAAGEPDGSPSRPYVNVGFTFQGLHAAGLPAGTLEQFPFEFREGMEARAGILGDLHRNHPSRWTLPEANWSADIDRPAERVQLSSVHAIVKLTWSLSPPATEWLDVTQQRQHPLARAIDRFSRPLEGRGVKILSVQSMQRFAEPESPHSRDLFGFVDGLSQPAVGGPGVDPGSDVVAAGDLFLGHPNSLGDRPLTGRLWDDSTFLVVRKLKQDLESLNAALASVDAEVAKAKMVGRWTDGRNLVDDTLGNDFDYRSDPDGALCPLHSHVRRANPRAVRDDIRTVPRILRRGMSYGPRDGAAGEERGVVFMAYCASIAEQFEVIQSWLGGGNSGGAQSYSGVRDPLLGLAHPGDPSVFVYRHGGEEIRLALPADRPFVQLQWGVYLFVPSRRALEEIKQIAHERAADEEGEGEGARATDRAREIERAVLAQKGAAVIARLQYVEQTMGPETARLQWKIALEDLSARMSGISRVVWAAVRDLHRGTLRTPYGVLVCSKDLVLEVFANRHGDYTVSGYAKRMDKSFGSIYLGMDASDAYHAQADAPNAAIRSITEQEAFDAARRHTVHAVRTLVPAGREMTVDVKDIVDNVLAGLSRQWFGLPDETSVRSGGWHWRADTPSCPGHFHSPSRYMFQPHPGAEAAEAGQHHGQALRRAVAKFVAAHRANGTTPDGPLGKALFEAFADDAALASSLIGVMMGFLPTVDGNLRGLLYEWVNDRSLWDHALAYRHLGPNPTLEQVSQLLLDPVRRTLQLRPVPELVWRIATRAHRLGTVDVQPGDIVVISIVSAMHEELANGTEDLYPLFGGNRDDDAPGQEPPTHACPGYRMAIGVLLGTLAGLLDAARLSPTLSPMALRIERRDRPAVAPPA